MLHALLLLAVVAGLIVITLTTARKNVVDVAVFEEKIRLETRVEAGVEMIVRDLVEQGQYSHWFNPPGVSKKFMIDEMEVEASVIDVRGLVDFNSATPALLEQLLSSRIGLVPTRQVMERLNEKRAHATVKWGTYADMSVALGLPIEQLVCLQPYMTLFSMQDQPDSRYASDVLKELFRIHGTHQKNSAISEENVICGQTYKIIVSTSGSLISSVNLAAELLVTGKTDQPYVLRSWMWTPQVDGRVTCKPSTEQRVSRL